MPKSPCRWSPTPTGAAAAPPARAGDNDVAATAWRRPTWRFSAVQQADGTAEGNAEIASRKFQLGNRDLVIHMRIDCLHILADGKTAHLSGVVTRTSYPDPEVPVGEVHRFSVQDNGESGAGADEFSGVPPLNRDCGVNDAALLRRVEALGVEAVTPDDPAALRARLALAA